MGLFVLTVLQVAVPVSASGEVVGVFPDRLITVTKESQKDNSYSMEISVEEPGIWWVELVANDGTCVVVQVYEPGGFKGGPLVSTDLRNPGDESKRLPMLPDLSYTAVFTYYGKRGSATLAEHFLEEPAVVMTPHERIQIWGDEDFTPKNGVVWGTGSQYDPYIIQGWIIDAENTYSALEVVETTAYFVIRSCCVYGGGESWAGVSLLRTTNGIVQDVWAYGCQAGIMVTSSDTIIVRNCISYSNYHYGIATQDSRDVEFISNSLYDQRIGFIGTYEGKTSIQSNVISGCECGAYLERIQDSTFTGNEITDCLTGIMLSQASRCSISQNGFSACVGSGGTIRAIYLEDCSIENNLVELTSMYGICIQGAAGIAVVGNTLLSNAYGLLIDSSSDIAVTGNVFRQNSAGILVYSSQLCVVSGNDFLYNAGNQALGYASEVTWSSDGRGNYWSDYTGLDEDGDGVGDTPYFIPYEYYDHFPLMQPCVL